MVRKGPKDVWHLFSSTLTMQHPQAVPRHGMGGTTACTPLFKDPHHAAAPKRCAKVWYRRAKTPPATRTQSTSYREVRELCPRCPHHAALLHSSECTLRGDGGAALTWSATWSPSHKTISDKMARGGWDFSCAGSSHPRPKETNTIVNAADMCRGTHNN